MTPSSYSNPNKRRRILRSTSRNSSDTFDSLDERNRSFRMWFSTVDDILKSKLGVGRDFLPDFEYADMFDRGVSSEDVAFMVFDKSYCVWNKSVWNVLLMTNSVPYNIFLEQDMEYFFKNRTSYKTLARTIKLATMLSKDPFVVWRVKVDKYIRKISKEYVLSDMIHNCFFPEITRAYATLDINPFCVAALVVEKYNWLEEVVKCINFNHTCKNFTEISELPLELTNLFYSTGEKEEDTADEIYHNIFFKTWYEKVDMLVLSEINNHLYDLPDEDYIMYFKEDYSVKQMAKVVTDGYWKEWNFFSDSCFFDPIINGK